MGGSSLRTAEILSSAHTANESMKTPWLNFLKSDERFISLMQMRWLMFDVNSTMIVIAKGCNERDDTELIWNSSRINDHAH